MTATTRLMDDTVAAPASRPVTALEVARGILAQVRVPEAIFLQDIAYDRATASGVGQFRCRRSSRFPNPDLRELTGGQLIDAATQMAYCLTGLMIHEGVDLLGLDLAGFEREIHAHAIHAVRSDFAFRHPCRFDRPFAIGARLQRFRNGELTLRRRDPRRYFVRLELEGTQPAGDRGGPPLDVFRARIAACRTAR